MFLPKSLHSDGESVDERRDVEADNDGHNSADVVECGDGEAAEEGASDGKNGNHERAEYLAIWLSQKTIENT